MKKFLAFYYGDEAQQILVDNGQPPVTTYQPQVDPEAQSALKAALDAATADGVTSPKSQPDLWSRPGGERDVRQHLRRHPGSAHAAKPRSSWCRRPSTPSSDRESAARLVRRRTPQRVIPQPHHGRTGSHGLGQFPLEDRC